MLNSADNETVLVEKAIAGDPDAFGELYQIYLSPLYRYIYLRVGNVSDAEDLTEQVFLKAWEALPGYRHRGHRFSSWLYRIAHNAVVDYHRRRKHVVPLSKLSYEQWCDRQRGLPEQMIAAEEAAELSSALAQLPEEQLRVIELRFAEGLNHEEVGQIINKSAGASRMIQMRALTTLGQVLNRRVTKAAGVAIASLLLLIIGVKLLSSMLLSLPGDWGYPVKRTIETIESAAVQSDIGRGRFQARLATRRLAEAVQLQEQQRYTDMQLALTAYHYQIETLLPYFGEASSLTQAEQEEFVNLLLATQESEETHLTQLLAQAPEALQPTIASALRTSQSVRQAAWQAVYGEPSVPAEERTPEPAPSPQSRQTPTATQSPTLISTPTYVLQASPTPNPVLLSGQGTVITTTVPLSDVLESQSGATAEPQAVPTDRVTPVPPPTSTSAPPPTVVLKDPLPTVVVPTVVVPTVVVPTVDVPTVVVPTVVVPTVVVPTVVVPTVEIPTIIPAEAPTVVVPTVVVPTVVVPTVVVPTVEIPTVVPAEAPTVAVPTVVVPTVAVPTVVIPTVVVPGADPPDGNSSDGDQANSGDTGGNDAGNDHIDQEDEEDTDEDDTDGG